MCESLGKNVQADLLGVDSENMSEEGPERKGIFWLSRTTLSEQGDCVRKVLEVMEEW